MSPKSSPVSLRSLALDHIGSLAAALQKADPQLTKEAATALAAQSPEGRAAYRIYTTPGMGGPLFETLEHMAKGEVFQEKASMRDAIIAKRAKSTAKGDAAHETYLASRSAQLAKLGTPASRARVTVDPHTPKPGYVGQPIPASNPAPAMTPADHIYAAMIEAARREAAPGRSESGAMADYLGTSSGAAQHAAWNSARRLQDS